MASRPGSKRSSRKLFHKIGEVCELTKTEPYVLRYWESEFPFLAPEKNSAGQRIYNDEDIDTVHAIKRLLYEEGYTTAGARRRLEQERDSGLSGAGPTGHAEAQATPSPSAPSVSAEADLRLKAELRTVRESLMALRALLTGEAIAAPSPEQAPAVKAPRRKTVRRPRSS